MIPSSELNEVLHKLFEYGWHPKDSLNGCCEQDDLLVLQHINGDEGYLRVCRNEDEQAYTLDVGEEEVVGSMIKLAQESDG